MLIGVTNEFAMLLSGEWATTSKTIVKGLVKSDAPLT